MKKNLKYLLASLALVGLLVGCGKNNNSDKSKETTTSEKTEEVLTVGVEGTFPPFNYHDDKGELVGFEVELATAVAEKLNRKIEFTETKWDSLIAGLDVDKYDAVFNNITITDERAKKYDFSTPYIYSQATLAVKDDSDIKSLDDFNGKKSAQTISSNYARDAEALGAEVVPTDGFAQSIELVTGGRADGTINDNVTFYYYQKEKPDNNIRLVEGSINTSEIAVLINKKKPELKDEIDKALKELADEGITSELAIKYFGNDITQK